MKIRSVRAEATTLRTYCRPLDEAGTQLENWDQVGARVRTHQENLWLAAKGTPNSQELDEFGSLVKDRLALPAGRQLWLGGTKYGVERACCNFNCAYQRIATVYDIVDASWLLLNGCGDGFRPVVGTLHGYLAPIPNLEIIPSARGKDWKGRNTNTESQEGDHWIIRIGDSAEAWAKAMGKMMNPPTKKIAKLILDFSQVRGPGGRLKGYGWICNGYLPLAQAMTRIHEILNRKAGDLLDEIDILDVVNHIGTILSSRRSAQISLLDYGSPRWQEFADAKLNYWEEGNEHRRQSNNSLNFWTKPTRRQLEDLFVGIFLNGEPGFVNGEAARRRAPWYDGLNPCAEILLPNRGFCNLVTTCLPAFKRSTFNLERAVYVITRANYRQTCVNLRDGVLSPEWDQTNQALRLCGSSLTGCCQADWLTDYQLRRLRNAAIAGAYSMADELGLPRPKAVTTIKPEGTSSKIMDCTEGINRPLGRYIFNWINFSIHDPIIGILEGAGYRTLLNPSDSNNMLVCFPVDYPGVRFDGNAERPLNLEPAISQLERYRRFLTNWADHNVSCTISFDLEEIPDMVDWMSRYWDDYVAVSFLRRTNPTLTAKDLGHPYLPQEVVTKSQYAEYLKTLKPVSWDGVNGQFDIDTVECAGGVCPIK